MPPEEPGKEHQTETVPLKGTEDEGSLSSILGDSPHPVFSGHPAMGEQEAFEPPPDEGAEPPAGARAGEEPPETPPEPPPEPPARKYKSWDEAEAGAREHQRFATEKAEEAKRAREEAEALKARLAEKESGEPEKEPSKATPEVESERETRIERALEEIGELDEYDPEYRKKVARAWVKAGFGGGSDESLDTLIDRRVEERIKAREEEDGGRRVRQRAIDLAKDQGLDMAPGSDDQELFWTLAARAPEGPFEEQVKWTAGAVKRVRGDGAPSGPTEEERRLAREAQDRNTPLERGGARPPTPGKPEPYSLNTIVQEQMNSRRI